nr:hypothetical protein [uncultured Helicobacter sp.]
MYPLLYLSLVPCHTERSEVSHNAESKRDFSHSLVQSARISPTLAKMTKKKSYKITEPKITNIMKYNNEIFYPQAQRSE